MLLHLPPTTKFQTPAEQEEYHKNVRMYDMRQGPIIGAMIQFIESESPLQVTKPSAPRTGLICFALGTLLIGIALIKIAYDNVHKLANTLTALPYHFWASLCFVSNILSPTTTLLVD